MQIDQVVLTVLSLATVSGNAVTLTGQLDRKLYERTNKVLEAAGGKWNRKAKAHIFDGDAADRMDQIILTGSVDIPKDEFEFFPTPDAVASRMFALADLKAGMRVLEPSAGRGNLIACIRGMCAVDCVEKMPANAAYLRGMEWLSAVQESDFLTIDPVPIYDRVLMNPPFGRQSDIHHVCHALKFLKPGGVLVSVMSAGISFRQNKLTREFLDLVSMRGGMIEDLPEGAFKSSGTMVNTVIVVIPN